MLYFGYGVSLLGFFKVGFWCWIFVCLGDGLIKFLLIGGGCIDLIVFLLFVIVSGCWLMVFFLSLVVWCCGGLSVFVFVDWLRLDIFGILFCSLFVSFCIKRMNVYKYGLWEILF